MEHAATPGGTDGAASSAPTPAAHAGPPFPVVGLGASAGGLEALQALFDHMPPDTGMAFVVILHLAPDYESQAAALLQSHTSMRVTQVTETVLLAPNHVYVIPPAQHLQMVDGHLRLVAPAGAQGRRVPIDTFFRTLAETHDSSAAAVILSGTGSDGSVGLKRIKEQGGAIFVQDPQEAAYDGMPRSAIATGLADFVLPIAAIPAQLTSYWRRAAQLAQPAAPTDDTTDQAAAMREILALLLLRTTHDFRHYKRPTLLRRITRRLQVTGTGTFDEYLAVLRSRPAEVQALLVDLLISVTSFFRDQAAWTALDAVVPRLFAGKGPGDQLRVWVTACATGEEVYSVAMLLAEHARTLDQPPAIQIFATDIDAAAIGRARQGSYPETIAGDVSPERLAQFFVHEQGHYRITQELREMVLFAQHNVLRDPPFGKLDLITCRNLLIYLQPAAQERAIRLFHFSLRPGGYLLLGAAESLDGVPELFNVVAPAQRLFQTGAVPSVVPPLLPVPDITPPPPARESFPGRTPALRALEQRHQQLRLRHAPPSAVVTAAYEIVHLSPGAERYVQFPAGEPSLSILRVAHPDLRLDLRTALISAQQQGRPAERRHVRVAVDGSVRLLDLVVEPVAEADWPGGTLLVLFRDVGAPASGAADASPGPDAQVQELAAELERSREQLQATTEAYEVAGEEHKAANEELQAINEELRAATEELETSKEELQAVNEELRTVNQELKHTVDAVTQSNNDLQNLIAATEIATLFVDRDLRLTRYTPSAEAIFNLIPSDLNRPLAHITHTLQYERLVADAAHVLASLQPVVREVATTAATWYLTQMRPYRTTDDRIAGVVLTLVDITARRRSEAALAERARLLDLSNDAIIVCAVDDRIISWNHGASELYGWARDEALGHDMHTLLQTEFDAPFEQLVATLQQHDRLEGEGVQMTKDGRRIGVAYRWSLDRDAQGRPGAILMTYNNITERRRAEAERERLLAETEQARRTAETAVLVRDRFLAIASHELRTPLTTLLGYAELLQRKGTGGRLTDANRVRLVERVVDQAQHLTLLLRQMFDVTQLARGQFDLVRDLLDIGALVERVVDDVRLSLGDQATRWPIALARAPETLLISGDAARLEQVVDNLLRNAVKYSPDGGPIRIGVARQDTEVALAVTDSGIGIPEDALVHLFDSFYRAPNVSSITGLGIGLHVVQAIVERHGGRITVASEEGQGSTFTVWLPRSEPPT